MADRLLPGGAAMWWSATCESGLGEKPGDSRLKTHE